MSIADTADENLDELQTDDKSDSALPSDDEAQSDHNFVVESLLLLASDHAEEDSNRLDDVTNGDVTKDEATEDEAIEDEANDSQIDSEPVSRNLVDGGEGDAFAEHQPEPGDGAPPTPPAVKLKPRLKPVRRGFAGLNLCDEVLQAILDEGYDQPTPIQRQTIPHVLAGLDLLGQAETGSGKTAAFACPLLSTINLDRRQLQVLVLTPTRELAIQVTEAIERYAAHLPGFRAVTIYGGQGYGDQLSELKRGVHIVVGTPGRVMDHMRRDTLKLHDLKCLVLDEADEMLRMGFVDDVEWILTMTPQHRQILLFSATLPEPIRRIAQQHLKDPQQVTVKGRNITADAIQQRYVITSPHEKLDMLTRILESESTDGVLVFVRTRNQTVSVAEQLGEAGYSAAPLNGDMPQLHRERTVNNFRRGKLAVLVATDVAARGLDIDRVSHVINYDFPHDTEAYVHRIGRTGRAGRSGQAILFVSHREKGRLIQIEAATNQQLELMHKPSIKSINAKRIARFKQQIIETAANEDLRVYAQLIAEIEADSDLTAAQIAAALAKLTQRDVPLVLKDSPRREHGSRGERKEGFDKRRGNNQDRERSERGSRGDRSERRSSAERPPRDERGYKRPGTKTPAAGMQRYRIEVGRAHGVGPKNIVGAIANESGLGSESIGRIEIHDLHSTVDLPEGLTGDFFRSLKGVRVGGQRLQFSKENSSRTDKPGFKKDFGKRKFNKPAGTAKKKFKGEVKAKGKNKAKGPRKDKNQRVK